MRELFVLYDDRCGLCREARIWLQQHRAYVPLTFIPGGSELALRRFPGVTPGELAVVSDSGEVWKDERAFLMCLWALVKYRGWAKRLSSPALLPVARQFFAAVSSGRFTISRMMAFASDRELQEHFSTYAAPVCEMPAARKAAQ